MTWCFPTFPLYRFSLYRFLCHFPRCTMQTKERSERARCIARKDQRVEPRCRNNQKFRVSSTNFPPPRGQIAHALREPPPCNHEMRPRNRELLPRKRNVLTRVCKLLASKCESRPCKCELRTSKRQLLTSSCEVVTLPCRLLTRLGNVCLVWHQYSAGTRGETHWGCARRRHREVLGVSALATARATSN
jgi:hypothetical protein